MTGAGPDTHIPLGLDEGITENPGAEGARERAWGRTGGEGGFFCCFCCWGFELAVAVRSCIVQLLTPHHSHHKLLTRRPTYLYTNLVQIELSLLLRPWKEESQHTDSKPMRLFPHSVHHLLYKTALMGSQRISSQQGRLLA